ncbi:uncharacterized protein LOC144139845 [Haemaphysalis longicornis]
MDKRPPPAVTIPEAESIQPVPQLEQEHQRQQTAADKPELRTGAAHTLPCTDSADDNAPLCELFHRLPSWNRVLWHISMQLQEVDAPGKLSLVRVSHDGIGWQQESTALKTLDISELVVGDTGLKWLSASLKRHRSDLWTFDCDEADLSVGTSSSAKPQSSFLEALFWSKSVTVLHVSRFVFGEENLRFLAESVRNSGALSEFYFLPLEDSESHSFIPFLVPGIAANYALLRLHTSSPVEEETTEDQFIVQDVMIRNRGLVTCAAHFVDCNVQTDHCTAAIERVKCSLRLVERVSDHASVDKTEAVARIQMSVPARMWGQAGRH